MCITVGSGVTKGLSLQRQVIGLLGSLGYWFIGDEGIEGLGGIRDRVIRCAIGIGTGKRRSG